MSKQTQINELRKNLALTDLRNSFLQTRIRLLEERIDQLTLTDEEDKKTSYEDLKDQIKELMKLDQFKWVSIDGNGDVYISTHQLELDEKYDSWDGQSYHHDDYDTFNVSNIGKVQLRGLDWKQCQWRLHELLESEETI